MEIVEYDDSDDRKAYRVKVSVRNNLLLTAIEDAGYKSITQFAKDLGYEPGRLQGLVSMRQSPINKSGEFSEMAKRVMEVLGAAPNDLWTTEQLNMNLSKNSIEWAFTTKFFIDTKSMQSVLGNNVVQLEGAVYDDIETPEESQIKKELESSIQSNLETLTSRDAHVLRMRFGLDGESEHTLEEVAENLRVTRERVRQIEAKALRKLRQPARVNKVKDFLGENYNESNRSD